MYEPSEYGRYVRHLRHESARFQAEYEDAAARLAETRGALIERTDERDVLQRQTEAALTLCDEMYETGYDIAEADPGSAVAFQLGRWSERLRAALSGVVDAQTEGKAEK